MTEAIKHPWAPATPGSSKGAGREKEEYLLFANPKETGY